jgi:hypothetical protein
MNVTIPVAATETESEKLRFSLDCAVEYIPPTC